MILDPVLDLFRGKAVTIPPFDGAFRPNTRLDDAHAAASLAEADNLARLPDGLVAGSGNALYRIEAGKEPEMQLMIRHPNNSGLQRDPLTQYFIPAHFIQDLSISQGDRPILSMEGGISISEDPHFRFSYLPGASDSLEVTAEDTDGTKFSGRSGNPS